MATQAARSCRLPVPGIVSNIGMVTSPTAITARAQISSPQLVLGRWSLSSARPTSTGSPISATARSRASSRVPPASSRPRAWSVMWSSSSRSRGLRALRQRIWAPTASR